MNWLSVYACLTVEEEAGKRAVRKKLRSSFLIAYAMKLEVRSSALTDITPEPSK